MDVTRPAALSASAMDPAQIAKAALRRLALEHLEPTPDNYARAYAAEAGELAPADGAAIAALIERIVRGLERGSRGWTAARKKDSLQRVLDGSRSDLRRMQQRVTQLVVSWDAEPSASAGVEATSAPAHVELAAALPGEEAPAVAPIGPGLDGCRQDPGGHRAARLARPGRGPTRGRAGAGGAAAATAGRGADGGADRHARTALPAGRHGTAAPPPPARPNEHAVRRTDRQPDRPGRERQLGPRPVRAHAGHARRRLERAACGR